MPLVWEDEDDDWAEKPSIKVVSNAELTKIMSEQDVCAQQDQQASMNSHYLQRKSHRMTQVL
jgi:hypothetical protein